MAAAARDLKLYLSGGASNTDPDLSLGGVISTTQLKGQTATYTTTSISGVSLVEANIASEGGGELQFTNTGTTLAWKAPLRSVFGTAVDVSTDGEYILVSDDDASYLRVSVTAASLPGTDTTRDVTVANDLENLFDNVSAAESLTGKVEYRCIYLKNTDGADSMTVGIYIGEQSSGADSVAVGLEPGPVDSTAQTIANEATAPVSVTFSTPATSAAALTVTLAAGQKQALWIRRTLPGYNEDSTAEARFSLVFDILV